MYATVLAAVLTLTTFPPATTRALGVVAAAAVTDAAGGPNPTAASVYRPQEAGPI